MPFYAKKSTCDALLPNNYMVWSSSGSGEAAAGGAGPAAAASHAHCTRTLLPPHFLLATFTWQPRATGRRRRRILAINLSSAPRYSMCWRRTKHNNTVIMQATSERLNATFRGNVRARPLRPPHPTAARAAPPPRPGDALRLAVGVHNPGGDDF